MRGLLRGYWLATLKLWRACLRHPRTFCAGFALLLAFFALQLPKLTAELRIYDIVDPRFGSTEKLREMKSQFGDDNSVLLLFAAADGSALTGEQVCHVRAWLDGLDDAPPALSREISGVLDPFLLRHPSLVRGRVQYDPVLPEPRCDAAPFSARVLADTPWAGFATNAQGTDLAAQVSFRDTLGGSKYGKFDPTPIGLLWKSLQTDLLAKTPGLRAYLGGRSSFQWYYQQALKRDSLINLAVLVVLLLLFRVFYGTWRSGLILMSIILAGAVLIFGAMSLAGSPVDYLSNSLFLMMCIAAGEDFIFISHDQLRAGGARWRPSARRLLMPGFFTSLTTLVGFLSLETADLRIIRRFGLWAGWAAICEWAVMFFVLPAALKALGAQRAWVAPARQGARSRLGELVERLAALRLTRPALLAAGVLFAASLFGFARLEVNDSPRANFLRGHPQRQAYEYLRRSRGWEGPLFVIFPDAYAREANEQVLARLARDPNVARVEDPYRLKDYFTRGFDEGYQRWIGVQLTMSRTYRGFFSRLDSARATLDLKSLDLADLNATISRIDQACAAVHCYAAGEGVVFAEYSNRVVGTLFSSFVSSLLLVGGIILFLARALGARGRARLLFSVFWSPVLVVGGLALFRVPLNFTTSMFASVLVGLTGDNAVQYLFASRRGNLASGIERRGGASVHVTAVAAGASLLFLGLTLVPLKILGLLLCAGFVISLAGDLWVLSSLIPPRT